MSFTDGLGEQSDPTRAGWVFAFIFSFQIVFMGKIGPLFSPGKYGLQVVYPRGWSGGTSSTYGSREIPLVIVTLPFVNLP